MNEVPVVGEPVTGAVLAHGRHRDAIPQHCGIVVHPVLEVNGALLVVLDEVPDPEPGEWTPATTEASGWPVETAPDPGALERLGSPAAWIEGEAVDISAGGTGLDLPQRFPQGTPLEIELTLLGEPTATVRCVGRVAFAARPDGAQRPVGLFRMGVAYEAIHPADREAMVRYFFKLQRAQLRERHQEP